MKKEEIKPSELDDKECVIMSRNVLTGHLDVLFRGLYLIMVDDVDRTNNINMHTFECFAWSEYEAIGKMVIERPEFRNRKIISITKTV